MAERGEGKEIKKRELASHSRNRINCLNVSLCLKSVILFIDNFATSGPHGQRSPGMFWRSSLSLCLSLSISNRFLFLTILSNAPLSSALWPLPASYEHGQRVVWIASKLVFHYAITNQVLLNTLTCIDFYHQNHR